MADMCFPGGKRKALTLSYDDGVEQDKRLLEIMAKHGLKGTFNLNSGAYAPEGHVWPAGQVHRRMSKSEVIRVYGESGQEIAMHTYQHPDLTGLLPTECVWQVMRDKEELENQFGRVIRGIAYPYGTFNDSVVNILQNCGVAYARTVMSTGDFFLPGDWLRLPATCHHNDPRLMSLARKFAENENAWRPMLFYLWGHSYEFEANDNWRVMEEFAAYMGGRADIWYATNIEIYDYVQAYRRLHISADGRRAENPSAIPVWVRENGKTVAIAPGETAALI